MCFFNQGDDGFAGFGMWECAYGRGDTIEEAASIGARLGGSCIFTVDGRGFDFWCLRWNPKLGMVAW